MKPEIITTRLKINVATSSDASEIFQLRTDPVVTKFISRKPVNDISEMEQFIERINADNTVSFFYTIRIKDNNELIGTIGLKRIDLPNRYAEIGYELFPQHHRKGYMSEAIKAMLVYVNEQLKINSVEAFTHRDNIASRKMLERLGFEEVKGKVDEGNLNNVIYCWNLSLIKRSI